MITPLFTTDVAVLSCDARGCASQMEAPTAKRLRAAATAAGWRLGDTQICPHHPPAQRVDTAWMGEDAALMTRPLYDDDEIRLVAD